MATADFEVAEAAETADIAEASGVAEEGSTDGTVSAVLVPDLVEGEEAASSVPGAVTVRLGGAAGLL